MALLICLFFSARAARGKDKNMAWAGDTTARTYTFKGVSCTIVAPAAPFDYSDPAHLAKLFEYFLLENTFILK
jgi:hypothetical protein